MASQLYNTHHRQRRHTHSAARWGGVFFEMAICCGLLALVLAAVAQTSVQFLHQQRAASLREIAAREAANLLDESLAVRFDNLTTPYLEENVALDSVDPALNGVLWRVVEHQDGDVRAKEVDVTVQWRTRREDRTSRLTMWRFAPLMNAVRDGGDATNNNAKETNSSSKNAAAKETLGNKDNKPDDADKTKAKPDDADKADATSDAGRGDLE